MILNNKGYLCCKRRVLEFDEFLKIEGCKTGRHVFVPRKTSSGEVRLLAKRWRMVLMQGGQEELVKCRMDHYQTPSSVQVSVYAKKADAARSVVRFEEAAVRLVLFLSRLAADARAPARARPLPARREALQPDD